MGKSIEAPRKDIRFVLLQAASDPAWLGLGLFVTFLLLYSVFAIRLAQGDFYLYYNLIFDLDPQPYAEKLTKHAAQWQDPDHGLIKHPLFVWLAPLTAPVQAIGLDWKSAAGLFAAATGAASVAVAFHVFVKIGATRIDALLLSLVFGLGATSVFNGAIAESYVIATLTLTGVWYFAMVRRDRPDRYRAGSVAMAVLTFGVTVTNVIQAGIAELFVRLRNTAPLSALYRTALFTLTVCAVAFLAIAVTWPEAAWLALSDPNGAIETVYLQRTTESKTGLGPVLTTFFAYSYAAPLFDRVPHLDEGILMYDFRSFSYTGLGTLAVGLWLGFWTLMTGLALYRRSTRWLAAALLAAIAFNILLHLDFQLRYSLYLYTGHIFFLLVATTAAGLAALRDKPASWRRGARAALFVLVIFAGFNNLPRAWEGATAFDAVVKLPLPGADY